MADNEDLGISHDLLGYDKLVENALLSVVRGCLERTAHEGMLGDHHFYITFNTEHRGVTLSDELRAKYSPQMTIVLQHQFDDLTVGDHGFSVRLSFGGRSHYIEIPWSAVKGFVDPSVNFGLQFGHDDGEELDVDSSENTEPSTPFSVVGTPESTSQSHTEGEQGGSVSENESNVVTLDSFRR